MRAAVVPGFGQPLVIEDRPVPEPGPGQVTVRMEASGLCHTDIHAANGDWPAGVNEAIAEVLHGTAKARLVLEP
jgi:propanol-preferring alcohol dehydrogenase